MIASEILKIHEIKKTPGRIAIINALQQNDQPLSETEIKSGMNEMYDRITFYRNIQTLTTAGIVHKIVIDNTIIKYELSCSGKEHTHHNEHAHFYCEECHSVTCLKQIKIPEFNLPEGFMYDDSDIIIKGTCKKCSHQITTKDLE
ncbi:MAG: transcriptional repressor [Paludibacter sp.]|nr:transcriptional repressor [Paludibacter sp.]